MVVDIRLGVRSRAVFGGVIDGDCRKCIGEIIFELIV